MHWCEAQWLALRSRTPSPPFPEPQAREFIPQLHRYLIPQWYQTLVHLARQHTLLNGIPRLELAPKPHDAYGFAVRQEVDDALEENHEEYDEIVTAGIGLGGAEQLIVPNGGTGGPRDGGAGGV
jgi:hypothetical protein